MEGLSLSNIREIENIKLAGYECEEEIGYFNSQVVTKKDIVNKLSNPIEFEQCKKEMRERLPRVFHEGLNIGSLSFILLYNKILQRFERFDCKIDHDVIANAVKFGFITKDALLIQDDEEFVMDVAMRLSEYDEAEKKVIKKNKSFFTNSEFLENAQNLENVRSGYPAEGWKTWSGEETYSVSVENEGGKRYLKFTGNPYALTQTLPEDTSRFLIGKKVKLTHQYKSEQPFDNAYLVHAQFRPPLHEYPRQLARAVQKLDQTKDWMPVEIEFDLEKLSEEELRCLESLTIYSSVPNTEGTELKGYNISDLSLKVVEENNNILANPEFLENAQNLENVRSGYPAEGWKTWSGEETYSVSVENEGGKRYLKFTGKPYALTQTLPEDISRVLTNKKVKLTHQYKSEQPFDNAYLVHAQFHPPLHEHSRQLARAVQKLDKTKDWMPVEIEFDLEKLNEEELRCLESLTIYSSIPDAGSAELKDYKISDISLKVVEKAKKGKKNFFINSGFSESPQNLENVRSGYPAEGWKTWSGEETYSVSVENEGGKRYLKFIGKPYALTQVLPEEASRFLIGKKVKLTHQYKSDQAFDNAYSVYAQFRHPLDEYPRYLANTSKALDKTKQWAPVEVEFDLEQLSQEEWRCLESLTIYSSLPDTTKAALTDFRVRDFCLQEVKDEMNKSDIKTDPIVGSDSGFSSGNSSSASSSDESSSSNDNFKGGYRLLPRTRKNEIRDRLLGVYDNTQLSKADIESALDKGLIDIETIHAMDGKSIRFIFPPDILKRQLGYTPEKTLDDLQKEFRDVKVCQPNAIGSTHDQVDHHCQELSADYKCSKPRFYHEKQKSEYCGIHALNAMCGGRVTEPTAMEKTVRRVYREAGFVTSDKDAEEFAKQIHSTGLEGGLDGAFIYHHISDLIEQKRLPEVYETTRISHKIREDLLQEVKTFDGDRCIIGRQGHYIAFRKNSRDQWVRIDSLSDKQEFVDPVDEVKKLDPNNPIFFIRPVVGSDKLSVKKQAKAAETSADPKPRRRITKSKKASEVSKEENKQTNEVAEQIKILRKTIEQLQPPSDTYNVKEHFRRFIDKYDENSKRNGCAHNDLEILKKMEKSVCFSARSKVGPQPDFPARVGIYNRSKFYAQGDCDMISKTLTIAHNGYYQFYLDAYELMGNDALTLSHDGKFNAVAKDKEEAKQMVEKERKKEIEEAKKFFEFYTQLTRNGSTPLELHDFSPENLFSIPSSLLPKETNLPSDGRVWPKNCNDRLDKPWRAIRCGGGLHWWTYIRENDGSITEINDSTVKPRTFNSVDEMKRHFNNRKEWLKNSLSWID